MSKYNYNKDYFMSISSEHQAYWLGFLYADGCICRNYKNDKLKSMHLHLALCDKDKGHLEKFVKDLESNIPIHDRIVKLNGKEYRASDINVCCTKLCYDLIDKGCVPQKTYDISFPDENIVPKKFMRDFLRGFFDGDGCICVNKMEGRPHITLTVTGMKNMLDSIVGYFIDEKIITTTPTYRQDTRSRAWNIYFHGNDSIKDILDYLYKDSTIYLDRKYNKYIDYYKNWSNINKRGVHWHKENKAYVVTIRINGEAIRVGQYKNLEDAIAARKEAEIKKYNIEKCRAS